MEWAAKMNEVIDYVEKHLEDEVNSDIISRIAASPFSVFQRVFIETTGISLSEYVRRRRFSCAAVDLLNTSDRIIDIALRYGYQSADAFTVAFRSVHGVTPSLVRKQSVKLTYYCPLSFRLTIKGVDRMDYEIVKKEPFKVMGIRRTTPYGGGTWAVIKSDGTYDKLGKLNHNFCNLGLCFGFKEDGSNDYMCGILWDKEELPGYDSYTYPETQWILFEAVGKISENVLTNLWTRINNEFLPGSIYKKSGLPTIEKYDSWDETADVCRVEVWIPVAIK